MEKYEQNQERGVSQKPQLRWLQRQHRPTGVCFLGRRTGSRTRPTKEWCLETS